MPRGRRAGAAQAAPELGQLVNAGVEPDFAALGARVGQLRVERGWTWQQLADKADINHRQVKDIEAGRRDISYSTLVKLCRVFDFPGLGEFLGPLASPGHIEGYGR